MVQLNSIDSGIHVFSRAPVPVFCAEGSVARPTIFESLEAGEPLAEEGIVDEQAVINFSYMHSPGAAR